MQNGVVTPCAFLYNNEDQARAGKGKMPQRRPRTCELKVPEPRKVQESR